MTCVIGVSKKSLDVFKKLRGSNLAKERDPISIKVALKELDLADNKSNRLAIKRAFRQLGFEYVRIYLEGSKSECAFLKTEEVKVARRLMSPLNTDDD